MTLAIVPRTNLTAATRDKLALFDSDTIAEFGGKMDDHDAALDAVVADASVSPAVTVPMARKLISIAIPDAATATYTYVTSDKIQIVDVTVIKSGAGAANTIQVKDGAGNAISDAIAAAVDKTVTRAGTLDPAHSTLNAGASFEIVATKAAGSMLAQVILEVIERA